MQKINLFELLPKHTFRNFNYCNSTKKYLHPSADHAIRALPFKSVPIETCINCSKQVFQIQTPK